MSSRLEDFSDIHFDVLKEIGNIGCGNAVTSLTKMLNKRVVMKVPQVTLEDFKNVSNFIGGPENIIIGILVGLSGDINGMMMFLAEKRVAHNYTEILMGMPGGDEFTEMELSALEEIGNIMCSAYLGSLSNITGKSVVPSAPHIAVDMAGAILSVPAIEFGKVSDKVLLIESVFEAEDKDISGFFVLVPDQPSFQIILSSLGVVL